MTLNYLVGDVRDQLATIPDGSIDLVLTSPPFLALRSYLPANHPDKDREIGSEPTPAAFLSTLLGLTAEWARVLAPHGSIAVELGDTYSGSGGAGGDYNTNGARNGQGKFEGSGRRSRAADIAAGILPPQSRPGPTQRDQLTGWPLDKSLCLIPQIYAASLAYGRNMLTGVPIEPWRVRQSVTWYRPNPGTGALADKWRPSTSEVVVACKSRRRYWDEIPTRVPSKSSPGDTAPLHDYWELDAWDIATAQYPGSHYAVMPEEIPRRCITTMAPDKVCAVCGKPSRRIVKRESTGQNNRMPRGLVDDPKQVGAVISTDVPDAARVTTVGWSDCGHDSWRAGVVLDPFAGSGTTLVVAHRLGRDAIGIDLDARNRALFDERLGRHEGGLFLDMPADDGDPALRAELLGALHGRGVLTPVDTQPL